MERPKRSTKKHRQVTSKKTAYRMITSLVIVFTMLLGGPAWASPITPQAPGVTPIAPDSGSADDTTGIMSTDISFGPFDFGAGVPDAPSRGQASVIKFASAEANYLGGIALDAAGKVWTWGYNAYGQLGTGRSVGDYAGGMQRLAYFVDNNINIVDIEGGYHTSFAVDDRGIVYAWGNGTQGEMGNGVTTASNTTPKIVTSLSGIKVVRVVCSTEWECAAFAIDDQGNVYAWGSGLYHRIPGMTSAVNNTAKRVSQFDSIAVVDLSIGESHGLALDSSGQVWSWGSNSNGQLGQGNTSYSNNPIKIAAFSGQVVTGISAEYHTSMAVTTDGRAYVWGTRYTATSSKLTSYVSPASPSDDPIYYSPSGKSNNVTTPTLIGFDLSSSQYNTTAPAAVSVTAGRYVNYLIDVNGRTWYMGWNVNYGFGTDGRLFTTTNGGKHSVYVTNMTLLRHLGDGDTEGYQNDVKGPVFSGVSATGDFSSQFNSYRNHGQWSQMADGLHPTIYDKKYMETTPVPAGATSHAKVYPLDSQGRRLVYVVLRESTSPTRYSGNFYVASDSYTGDWIVDNRSSTSLPAGVTNVTSVPSVKLDERDWIGMVVDLDSFDYTGSQLNELPYMKQITTYQSASLFVDDAGNLFRTSLDGSGSIAWGWDYSVYERSTAGNNAARGLYNFYFYEIMYMRGAPTIGQTAVSFERTLSKIYLVEDQYGQTPTDRITIKASVPAAATSSQLNLTVTPKMTDLRYVFIPYNTSDPNFSTSEPSAAQFEAAWASGAYETGNLLNSSTNYTAGNYSFTIDIKDNGTVWVLSEDVAYTRTATQVKTYVADNFYTPVEIKHRGVGVVDGTSYARELYAPTSNNVDKIMLAVPPFFSDTSPYLGLPLDANGNVIANPSFGYDRVSLTAPARLTGNLTSWQLAGGQNNPKQLVLDNVSYLSYLAGVLQPYVHDFYYESTGTASISVAKTVVDTANVYGVAEPDGFASPSEQLRYTITVSNSGTVPAFDLEIRDSLIGLLPHISNSLSDTVTLSYSNGTVETTTLQQLSNGLTIGLLDFGESLQISFSVNLNSGFSTSLVTQLVNTVRVGKGSSFVTASATIQTRPLRNGIVHVTVNWISPGVGAPTSVNVRLYKDGVATDQVIAITSANNWVASFTQLETGHSYSIQAEGLPINYRVANPGLSGVVTLTEANPVGYLVMTINRIES